jgi:hypothetical protein
MYLYEEETDETITVAEYRDIPKTSSTSSSIIKYNFDLEGYELQKIWDTIPYTKSRTVYIQIRTEEVNSEFDTYDFFTQDAYFTLVDEPPAFPYTEVADILAKTVALTGGTGMIKKYNKMSYKIDALPRKGAIITSQSMVVQGKTYTANEGTIDNLETNVFTFYATDSRGLTSSHTITVPMIEYFAPTVEQDLKITLDAAGGEAAKIEMSVEGTIFYTSFGAKNNTIKLEVRHTNDEGVMGDWVDLTVLIGQVGSGTYSMNTTITGLRYDRDYVFQSRVTDALNTVETTEYKITLKPVFDWGRDSFNFNVPITADNIARVYATYTLSDTTTDGVVELVDNMNNYDYIEILFTDNNGRGCGVAKFIPPGVDNNHTIDLFLVEASSSGTTYIRRTAYICRNNTLTPTLGSATYAGISSSSAATYSGNAGTNYIQVVRVLGYK